MAKVVYEVIAKLGEYKDRDGNTKQKFQRCGVVFESDKGLSLKLELAPVGAAFDGWFSLKPPQPKPESRPAPPAPVEPKAPLRRSDGFEDDDIPF